MMTRFMIPNFLLAFVLVAGSAWAASLDIRIDADTDDAEEKEDKSATYLGSTDLELTRDDETSAGNQTVGMRFNNVAVPQGAKITAAHIQFACDDNTGSEDTALTIMGEAADNPPTFTDAGGDISSRKLTTASVKWNPPPWETMDEAVAAQRTPDLAPVIQEIVNRPGWKSGNSIVVVITGTGYRVARSFEGSGGDLAPLLHIVCEGGAAPAAAAAEDKKN